MSQDSDWEDADDGWEDAPEDFSQGSELNPNAPLQPTYSPSMADGAQQGAEGGAAFVHRSANALTGGLLNKGIAGLEALQTGQPYDQALEATEGAMENLSDRNPVSGFAGDAVGSGVAAGLLPGKYGLEAYTAARAGLEAKGGFIEKSKAAALGALAAKGLKMAGSAVGKGADKVFTPKGAIDQFGRFTAPSPSFAGKAMEAMASEKGVSAAVALGSGAGTGGLAGMLGGKAVGDFVAPYVSPALTRGATALGQAATQVPYYLAQAGQAAAPESARGVAAGLYALVSEKKVKDAAARGEAYGAAEDQKQQATNQAYRTKMREGK